MMLKESREYTPSSPLTRPRRGHWKRVVLPVAWLLTVSFDVAAADHLVVIVSTSFPQKEVLLPELKRIYLGQRLFYGRLRLKTLHSLDPHLRDLFLEQVMGMSWPEFQMYCLVELCKDGVYAPRFLNDSEIIQAVQADAGTLGYIPWNEAHSQPDLRILLVLPDNPLP
jgi:hypothetical protein